MKTLDSVILKVEQINDFMVCIDDAMIDASEESGMNKSMDRLYSLVSILEDLLHNVSEELDEANGHIKVCNSILASAHVQQLEAELAELRAKVNPAYLIYHCPQV